MSFASFQLCYWAVTPAIRAQSRTLTFGTQCGGVRDKISPQMARMTGLHVAEHETLQSNTTYRGRVGDRISFLYKFSSNVC